MLVLGIDYETSGLNPETDRVLEVGAVLWDTEKAVPILIESHYVDHGKDFVPDPEAMAVNGINMDDVCCYGVTPEKSLKRQVALITQAQAVVAHNGERFDRLFFMAWMKRALELSDSTPWIDTQSDLPYPESMKTRKLVHLAAEHGFLNPFAHRAVFDVLTMLRVLSCYNVEEALILCQQPIICLAALVSYNDRMKASERGYRWHGASKTWWRSFRESQVAKEIAECGFPTKQISQPKEER